MPVTPYSEPSLQEFVSIKPVPTVSTQVEQGTVIVAPHYDITDLRDAAGNLNPAAKIGDTKISSLSAMWYASTAMGEYEFPIQSVDSARRVDASNMRVFGAVGTNQSLFEITGEKDEVIVRTGTASFTNSGSQLSLTDENANWSSIFTRNQIPFATIESAAAFPNYNKFALVARVFSGSERLGEFLVFPFVNNNSPKTLVLMGAPFANAVTFDGPASTNNYSYQLVYKPQFWSVEQAPTAAKARVVSMNRPALSTAADKVRLKLFRHVTGSNASTQSVPLAGGGSATLMNVSSGSVTLALVDGTVQNVPLNAGGTTALRNISTSNVTVTVNYASPAPGPPLNLNSAAWNAGTKTLTLTFNDSATRDSLSVADIVTLITDEAADALSLLEFDDPTSASVVNTSAWVSQDGSIAGTGTPTAVSIEGTEVTLTYYGTNDTLTVSEVNDLIIAESLLETPLIYFDEINVATDEVNFEQWKNASGFGPLFTIYRPETLIVPVYTTHVQNAPYTLSAAKPGAILLDDADGYAVTSSGVTTTITLNGRAGLFMTPAGVVSELFTDINAAIDSNAPVSGGDLYLRSPFKLLLTDEFLAHTSEWRILTPAGLTADDYNLFHVGADGTSYDSSASFDPSSFVASIDVFSNLLGSLGNRYQLQYRLAYDGSSSISYENETITITQAVIDSTGYLDTPLTFEDLVTALNSNPNFVDANGGQLFDYGNEWDNDGVAATPVQNYDENAPIYPECFASPTAGYYNAPTASVTVTAAASVNDVNFAGGTFRARVKINPLALYSNTSTATASIYVDFRALRLDTSAVTTLTAYGRRPDLVALTRDNYVDVLGPVVPNNPAAVAAHEFYRVGGQSALWFLGVDETDPETDGHQYGTPAAIGRAVDLIVRRTGYNIGVLSYGTEIRNLILQKISDLGGTETLRLVKGLDFWMPLKSPDRYPDTLVESADFVGTGGGYAYVYTTADFSSNEAAADAVEAGELFLVVASDPNASGADPEANTLYDLGDGKRGWKVTELIAQDDPSWVAVEGGFDYDNLEEGESLLFYRRGYGLVTATGRNMQGTAEAIAINESAAASMRLMKILGDTATRTINGVQYRLPHELVMVGQSLGLLQQLGPTEPCTGLEYFGIRELTGTNDIFTTAQLDLIRGGGVFIPTQEQAGARRTRVSFDVSSDMTNSYTINRCLHVTDDLLSERIRRRIDPLRSARRVDQLLIDEITLQINTEVESVQRKYEAINLVAVAVLTDAQKAKYGIDARRSGLYVQIYKKHPKISSDLILENIIEF